MLALGSARQPRLTLPQGPTWDGAGGSAVEVRLLASILPTFPMPETTDYKSLLDLRNVVAVDYDEDRDVVTAYVSQKLPEDVLDESNIVAQQVSDRETDVVDAGFADDRDGFSPLVVGANSLLDMEAVEDPDPARQDLHRPVESGLSEIHIDSSAATAGHYPARVTDPDRGAWADDITQGTLVRLSNCHVYARSGNAAFGDTILQPSPHDGGEDDDRSGGLAGYLPLEEGVRADVAARTTTDKTDVHDSFGLDESWPTAIADTETRRSLRGEQVTKTGRTTGITEAEVTATDASVRVQYPDPIGTVTLDSQLLTGELSKGGDSGSPVYTTDGILVGLVFAGSSRITAVSPIDAIEDHLGVEVLTRRPDDTETGTGDSGNGTGEGGSSGDGGDGSSSTGGEDETGSSDDPPEGSEESFEDYVEGLLVADYGAENVSRQHRFNTGRIADFLIRDPVRGVQWAFELENDAGSVINGRGQAETYAELAYEEDPGAGVGIPVLAVPAGHIDPFERVQLETQGIVVREFSLPDYVSVEGV